MIIYVCQRFEQSGRYLSVWKRRVCRLFVCLLARRIYIMSCALFDCLKRWFCAEFQTGTCNIIYKFAVHRDTRKGCIYVFSTRSRFAALSKPLPDTKIEREGCFKKMKGFLINFRICITVLSRHRIPYIKRLPQTLSLRQPVLFIQCS